ncbi:macrolide transporter subunit MacA [Vibrio sp. B1FLJ16]|uniref:macrolide transporter subunit MacA n=1 Tax=Vibrio sp. B1FLJ16 TaxID=2751178 RepID=UPI0015F756F3|nr:macrolide transporter subunit MacA [Vibrio sp. B1FLJ16]CAD7824032.1 Belongs to the membrane fusion protein (MFP) (TC 8.A.1) family [Vibrio sp. B1FLJ16]CAE6953487.1 Belongs to the membrane fusion protein (MFP) (TC 8.A.1) family [Vibrio sp. B1FLJ16]
MKLKKKWLVLCGVILAGAAGAYFFQPPEKPSSYATETVRKGNIEKAVLANGMLQASKLVNVGAQVSGQIQSLAVSLGDEIKQGDLIAQIDSLTQQNSLKEAQASLNSLNAQYKAKQAQIKQANSEYVRQKGMLAAKASSRSDFENAEASLAIYKAELAQLDAEIEKAKINVDSANVDLGYTTINAPMDGTVVYTSVEEGQTVNANQTTPTIIELAKLDTMTVKAEISEADVIFVHRGQTAVFTILGQPNKQYQGTLRAIEPGPTIMDGDDSDLTISDSDAIYYNAVFDVDNPEGILRIGMTAQVSIVLEESQDTLLIPAQVLQRAGGKNAYTVPVLENGQVVQKPVEVGINNKVNVEILSGLKEGDKVVLGSAMAGDSSSNRRPGPPMGL